MTQQPQDPIDKLVHRAHNTNAGAPPEFASRIRAQALAEAVTGKRARMIYLQAGIAAAAVVILALAIGLNTQWFTPDTPQQQPGSQDATAKDNEPVPTPPEPVIRPEPQPEPEGNTAPTPDRQPTPQPEPTPEPVKPDDVVEKPDPTPEPQPTPEPEPVKPDDVVEKPEPVDPKDPEGTEVKPDTPKRQLAFVSVIGEPKLQVRYGEADWADYDGKELYAGAALKCGRGSVDLSLDGGGQARFNGEILLDYEGDTQRFQLIDDSLYIDNLGTNHPVIALGKAHTVLMDDGACVVYATRLALEAVCLAGMVTLDDQTVEIGTSRRASVRGVADAKPFKGDRFLGDIPERQLLREDFTAAPPGGMYGDGEKLENGIAIQEKQPGYIAFRYNPTLTVLPGTVLRMRIRTTAASKLELELFTDTEIKPLKRNKQQMFKRVWSPEKNGDWMEIEVRLDELPDNEDPEIFPTHGTLLRNFKLHFTGTKLEIDWVEFVRVQD